MLGQLGTDTEGVQYMKYLEDNKIDNSLINISIEDGKKKMNRPKSI